MSHQQLKNGEQGTQPNLTKNEEQVGETDAPKTWIGYIRHWLPSQFINAAIELYMRDFTLDQKTRLANAIDEVERRYVRPAKVGDSDHYVDDLGKIHYWNKTKSQADRENWSRPEFQVLMAVRKELGLRPDLEEKI